MYPIGPRIVTFELAHISKCPVNVDDATPPQLDTVAELPQTSTMTELSPVAPSYIHPVSSWLCAALSFMFALAREKPEAQEVVDRFDLNEN